MINNDTGFFKIWRDLFKKPIWLNSTSDQRSILLAILYLANWKENTWEWKGKPYSCKPGEFISSYANIAKAAGKGVTTQKVRTAIKRFKNFDFLTDQTTHGYQDGIKIIVNNWENYQNETNRPINTSLTDNQQTTNFSLTTIEEYKESKNINNILEDKNKKFKIPSVEEIKSYCLERNNDIDAQHFFDYYEANGWHVGKNKMKDWKACVRTWESQSKNSKATAVTKERQEIWSI